MGIKVELDENLERRFRQLAMKRYGYSKGSIKKATESAIQQWTESQYQTRAFDYRKGEKDEEKRSAVDLMTGLLKDAKHKNSVQEQHEIRKLWVGAAEERRRR